MVGVNASRLNVGVLVGVMSTTSRLCALFVARPEAMAISPRVTSILLDGFATAAVAFGQILIVISRSVSFSK